MYIPAVDRLTDQTAHQWYSDIKSAKKKEYIYGG